MFVDRQSVFSYIKSLKLIISLVRNHRISGCKYRQNQKNNNIFYKKTDTFYCFFAIFLIFEPLKSKFSAAATAIVAQANNPPREPESQQHIVGRLQVGDGIGAEHESTHAIGGDVTLHAIDVILHRGSSHLSAHEGFATGTSQFVERHAPPVVGSIIQRQGQFVAGRVIEGLVTHCLRV